MQPRVSKYGFFTISRPASRGAADDVRLQGALGHSKRKSKAPVSLAPVRCLIAPRIDAYNPPPRRKVKDAKKEDQPKGKASKRRR